MQRRVCLLRVSLSYADGLVLHTASSGAVPALDELRLVVEQDGALAALGATRVNIEYLSGIPAEQLVAACVAAAGCIDWSGAWADLPGRLDAALPGLPAPARMLFEMAAADGAAREAGCSLAVFLGGADVERVPSNQTLFRCDDAVLLQRAEAYAARGFWDLKLRVGFGPFADDLRRCGCCARGWATGCGSLPMPMAVGARRRRRPIWSSLRNSACSPSSNRSPPATGTRSAIFRARPGCR